MAIRAHESIARAAGSAFTAAIREATVTGSAIESQESDAIGSAVVVGGRLADEASSAAGSAAESAVHEATVIGSTVESEDSDAIGSAIAVGDRLADEASS